MKYINTVSFPKSVAFPFLTIILFLVKPIINPDGFTTNPFLHFLNYMRFFQTLSFESLMIALMSVAETSMHDINCRIRTIQQESDIDETLKCLISQVENGRIGQKYIQNFWISLLHDTHG